MFKSENDLRIRILENLETSRKPQSIIELLLSAQSSPQNENIVTISKSPLKNIN